jgi:hypothetical protein
VLAAQVREVADQGAGHDGALRLAGRFDRAAQLLAYLLCDVYREPECGQVICSHVQPLVRRSLSFQVFAGVLHIGHFCDRLDPVFLSVAAKV